MAAVGGGCRRRQVDLQWRSGLSRAGELTLGLVENVVFGVDLDGALKAALKNRRNVAAMFASQPLIDDVEEALEALQNYMDSAVARSYKEVRVVHGKGTGALRAAVEKFLRRAKYVKEFRPGNFGEGDSGVTIVTLA